MFVATFLGGRSNKRQDTSKLATCVINNIYNGKIVSYPPFWLVFLKMIRIKQ